VIEERLNVPEPFDGDALVGFLGARAIPGLELVEGSTYRRSLALERGAAVVELTPDGASVVCGLELDDRRDLTAAVDACRRLLDLDADPAPIAAHLERDPLLRPLVRRRPGLRVPGAVDGFELAVRAIIGQQVSVPAARRLGARLLELHGRLLARPSGGVTHLFPTAAEMTRSDPERLPFPRSRGRALSALAARISEGRLRLDPQADRAAAYDGLLAIPGVGPWTASYTAMRALADPDVFLPTDVGVLRALDRLAADGAVRAPEKLAEGWRPWRSYAVLHLWTSLGDAQAGRAGQPRGPRARIA
jgi:AraC family transcriptional regulator, regulatory protein of adaptative response / DNA-3-methyladenine glycosylase II